MPLSQDGWRRSSRVLALGLLLASSPGAQEVEAMWSEAVSAPAGHSLRANAANLFRLLAEDPDAGDSLGEEWQGLGEELLEARKAEEPLNWVLWSPEDPGVEEHGSFALLAVTTLTELTPSVRNGSRAMEEFADYLWSWRHASEAATIELASEVAQQLAGSPAAVYWREWFVPVLLQHGEELPLARPAPEDPWSAALPLVESWLEASFRRSALRRGAIKTSGLVVSARRQPSGSGLPGEHPLVLTLLSEPESGLPDGGLENAGVQLLVAWNFERGLQASIRATAFMQALSAQREFNFEDPALGTEPGADAFLTRALQALVARWEEEGLAEIYDREAAERLRLFLRESRSWPGVSNLEDALFEVGRSRLHKAWADLQSDAQGRAHVALAAPVPNGTFAESVHEGGRAAMASWSQTPPQLLAPGAGAEDNEVDRWTELVTRAQNPFAAPSLLAMCYEDPPRTLEAHARIRECLTSMDRQSIVDAVDAGWSQIVKPGSETAHPWSVVSALEIWSVLRHAPEAGRATEGAIGKMVEELVRDLQSGATGLDARSRARLAFVCWFGLPESAGGKTLAKNLERELAEDGEGRDDFRACALAALAASTDSRALRFSHVPAFVIDRGHVARVATSARSVTDPLVLQSMRSLAGRNRRTSTGPVLFEEVDLKKAAEFLVENLPVPGPGHWGERLITVRTLARSSLQGRISGLAGVEIKRVLSEVEGEQGSRLIANPGAFEALAELWEVESDRVRQVRQLSLSGLPADHKQSHRRLAGRMRREIGGALVALNGEMAEAPGGSGLLRAADDGYLSTGGGQPPWWSLGHWAGAVSGSQLSPRMKDLVATAARVEQGLSHLKSRLDIDGYSLDDLPDRTFASLKAELTGQIEQLKVLEDRIEEEDREKARSQALARLTRRVEQQLEFDAVSAEHDFFAAMEEVRQAEFELEAARSRSLAAEIEYLASGLIVEAREFRRGQVEFLRGVAQNDIRIEELDAEKAELRRANADGEITVAEMEKGIASLDQAIQGIRNQQLASAYALLEQEVELLEAAFVTKTTATNPATNEPFMEDGLPAQFAGHIGAVARVAESQVVAYQAKIEKAKNDNLEQIRKLREGRCIRGLTKALGSLASLIPGAGPFIGMGIIAAGEIGAGVHEGRSFGAIALGLVDNAAAISLEAGFDIEAELNELGASVGAELDTFATDLAGALGPVFEEIPTFLDDRSLAFALDTTGLDGPMRQLVSGLQGVLVQEPSAERGGGRLGTVILREGRAAALRGDSPEELLQRLSDDLRESILDGSGGLRSELREMKDAAHRLGVPFERLLAGEHEAVDNFCRQSAALVLHRAAPAIKDERDRMLSTLAITVRSIQEGLREAKAELASEGERVAHGLSEFLESDLEPLLDEMDPELRAEVLAYSRPFARKLESKYKELRGTAGRLKATKPVDWDVLEATVEEELLSLLPRNHLERELFQTRLRLVADPEYAGTKVQQAVQPWQAALQGKLSKIDEGLSVPTGGGTQEQQLHLRAAQLEKAAKSLNQTLEWVRDDRTLERQNLRDQLEQLKDELRQKADDVKVGKLRGEQFELRLKQADVEIEIAMRVKEITEFDIERAGLTLDSARKADQIQALEEEIARIDADVARLDEDRLLHVLEEKRNLLFAADARLAACEQRSKGLRLRMDRASSHLERRAMELRVGVQEASASQESSSTRLDQARALADSCRSARALLRLMRSMGVPPGEILPKEAESGNVKADTLQVMLENANEAWAKQRFQLQWDQTIDLWQDEHGELIDRLFSQAGVVLDIQPSERPLGLLEVDVSAGRLGISLPHRPRARLIWGVVVAGSGYTGGKLRSADQGSWESEFLWLGESFDLDRGQITQGAQPAGRQSLRFLDLGDFGVSFYDDPKAGTNASKLKDEFLRAANMRDLSGLTDWGPFQSTLGPPLYGRHFVRVGLPPNQKRPEHVGIYLLYMYVQE